MRAQRRLSGVLAAGFVVACNTPGSSANDPPVTEPASEAEAEVGTDSGGESGGLPAEEMILIPGGEFMMGCDDQWPGLCPEDETPQHAVVLSPYEIDRLEVSVSDYASCVAEGACTLPYAMSDESMPPLCNWQVEGREMHPINCVDREQAEAYCAARDAQLPTEAQWEFAARGTSPGPYPWGDAEPSCALANTSIGEPCSPEGRSLPVGGRPDGASPFGVEDQVGNVREFLSDWYSSTYYARSPTSDPPGPEEGDPHFLTGEPAIAARGASYLDNFAVLATVSARSATLEGIWDHGTGFRCARDIGG